MEARLMKSMLISLALSLALWAQEPDRMLQEIQQAQAASLSTAGDVSVQLERMWKADQLARIAMPRLQGSDRDQLGRLLSEIDRHNTERLKALLSERQWFYISEFGPIIDQQAWLLVQHADLDPQFQREILSRLEPLVARGETHPGNFAYLKDRVACSFSDPSKRVPQTYGTQGSIKNGYWAPFPIDEPEKVDERRAAVGLGPLEDYTRRMNQLFGTK